MAAKASVVDSKICICHGSKLKVAYDRIRTPGNFYNRDIGVQVG